MTLEVKMKYFSYDSLGDGMVFHETAASAQAAAQRALDTSRDEASEGWDEEVVTICWGELRQGVVETGRKPWCEYLGCEDCDGNHEFDEYVDYELRDVEPGGQANGE